MNRFRQIAQNDHFEGKIYNFGPKTVQIWFFFQKWKMSVQYASYAAMLLKKNERFLEYILIHGDFYVIICHTRKRAWSIDKNTQWSKISFYSLDITT